MSIYSDAGYPCKYRAVILIQESFLNCSVVLLVFKSRVLENRLLQLHLAYLRGALLFQYVYWSFIRCRLVSSTRVKQVPGSNCFAESCSCFQETSTSLPVPRARFRLHSFNAQHLSANLSRCLTCKLGTAFRSMRQNQCARLQEKNRNE